MPKAKKIETSVLLDGKTIGKIEDLSGGAAVETNEILKEILAELKKLNASLAVDVEDEPDNDVTLARRYVVGL